MPRDPSESLIFLRNHWCFHSSGAAGVGNQWNSLNYSKFSGIWWNLMILVKSRKKHQKTGFGRSGAGNGLRDHQNTFELLLFLHVCAKVQHSCKFMKFPWIHGIQWFLWEISKFQEITWNSRKPAFSTNPWPFTKRWFFLGQIDGPAPWDSQNQQITRIPRNFTKFQDFH